MMRLSEIFRADCFLRKVFAMMLKEVLQLRRDRVTLATMISVPLMQLIMFGYAINTTPRHLPTAVLLQENTDVGRSIIAALRNTKYFTIKYQARTPEEFDHLLASGDVLVFGGEARLAYHGIDRILAGSSTLLPEGGRLNLTMRRVTKPD